MSVVLTLQVSHQGELLGEPKSYSGVTLGKPRINMPSKSLENADKERGAIFEMDAVEEMRPSDKMVQENIITEISGFQHDSQKQAENTGD